MIKRIQGCLLLLTLLFGQDLFAQDRIVTGTVTTTEEGQPLNGVSVLVPGTNSGTTTGANGRFTIRVPRGSTQLEFDYVGYVTQRVSVGAGANVKVSLSQDVRQLKDVVVVGYGTQRKSDITGAISSIKGSDLTQLSTQRVDQALQGRAAGVMVLNTDGAPGGNTTIRVRGSNSSNGGNNALIVIDGLQGGNLNSLKPNDIESIEVLKDASATAIYGAQGANGVVLITTKLGKKGKPVISYNYSYGVSKLRKKLDVMNAADFAKTINAAVLTQNGSGATPVPIFSEADIQNYEKNGGTDWQDVIYRTAPIQNHELSMSGGTDNLKYLVSGGFLNQQGILVNSEYQRYTLRANSRADVTKWSGFGLSWAGSKEAGNSPPFGSADISFLGNSVNVAPRWAPTEPIYDSLGNYSVHRSGYGASDTWNPLASALEPKIDNNTIRNVLNCYIEFRPVEGLSLRITGGANIANINNRTYHNQKTYEGKQNTGLGISFESMDMRFQNSNILTYDKTLNDHHLTFTAVAEQQYTKYNFSSLRASKFLVDQTGVSNLGGRSEE